MIKFGKILIFGIIVVVAIIGVAFYFGFDFYKGIKPALLSSSEDITKFESAKNNLGLQLPEGFSINIFAEDLGAPRVITFDPNGIPYASITKQGLIVALRDKNNDGFAEDNLKVLAGLRNPHGLAFWEDYLYVAEEDKIKRYKYDIANSKILDTTGEKIIDLPLGDRHVTRTIVFSKRDGKPVLYVSIGSTCDVCFEKDERNGTVMVMDPDGTNARIFATGLRNAVFIILSPWTGGILATEMGRDWLGDDLPPDEINILSHEGEDFGWPICYGDGVYDEKFNGLESVREGMQACVNAEPPFIQIPAHSSPLGFAFMDDGWGKEYEGDLFVAYHGSWNRSVPTGYKIVRFKQIAGNTSKTEQDFITGWLQGDGTSIGRPVDIKIGPDGAMYISDDKAGVIYRVTKD
ncbi:PQQ-dependent sugar dehydrogenase [Patescibacteria group bacterium]|nr:PQQ-dependent sugar dehydrogenase [Patescibacteria group bacterium]